MNGHGDAFEGLCSWVHHWWMVASRAHGRDSAPSRHGTGELMRPYEELAEIDREDDRRVVRVVLNGLRKSTADVAARLISDAPDDVELLALIADAAAVVDPSPAGLVDRCVWLAAGEDGQR